ncbi:MAG: hypothetical protein KDI55_00190 [Anaerolineae bacterium]|nr:hypothetical protein [Anaerolineae bacterium]
MSELKDLFPDQAVALQMLKEAVAGGARSPLIQAPTGFGKCLGIGTPVIRFDGRVVPVEDVHVGENLMGPDGLPRLVLSRCRSSGDLFRIVPTKGDPWVCNDVHVLTLVETMSGKVVDIALNEYLTKSASFKNTHKLFQPIDGIDFQGGEDPPIDPYWLGLWIGDGSKRLNCVGVTKADREVADACVSMASSMGMAIRVETSGGTRCPTHILTTPRGSPNPLMQMLRRMFGIHCERFPHSVSTASRVYRQEVLAGIIDMDGYVSKGCVEIIQKHKVIADGIAFIARSLGLKVVSTVKIVDGRPYYRMCLFGDFSGIVTRIPRKRIGPRLARKVATRTGFRVEAIGHGEYAGFELDGDGRFLLGDFTVTHNTVLAAHIVNGAYRKGNRIAFCVPSIGLIDQTFDRFVENGIAPENMGIIQADHPWQRPSAPIQICSVQTLARRMDLPDVRIAVIDEAHIRFKLYERWMGLANKDDDVGNPDEPDTNPGLLMPEVGKVPLFIGLTATPWTDGLGRMFDRLLKPTSLSDLIESGRLSKFKVFVPASGALPDLKGVKTQAGDFAPGQLEKRVSTKVLVGDIVSTWLEKAEGRPTLCFCVGRAHARMVHDQFVEVGIPVAYVDANTPRDERAEIGRQLAAGEIKVVCNIGTLTTGIDWDVRCIILARPTKSEALYVQILGRGLRVADGKDYCLILDHSDTTKRLGLVTDIDRDELDDGKNKDKKKTEKKLPMPKECKECHALVPADVLVCDCGFEFKPAVNVSVEDGHLEEISPFNEDGTRKKSVRSIDIIREMPRQQLLGELMGYQIERDFKPNWVAMKFKDVHGVWPNWGYRDYTKPLPISPMVYSWVKSRAIAWAKAKSKTQPSVKQDDLV